MDSFDIQRYASVLDPYRANLKKSKKDPNKYYRTSKFTKVIGGSSVDLYRTQFKVNGKSWNVGQWRKKEDAATITAFVEDHKYLLDTNAEVDTLEQEIQKELSNSEIPQADAPAMASPPLAVGPPPAGPPPPAIAPPPAQPIYAAPVAALVVAQAAPQQPVTLLDKVNKIKSALDLDIALSMPAAIEAANHIMGLPSQGSLPSQADALLLELGV